MPNIKLFFLTAVLWFMGIALAAPRPHIGMVNNDYVRDVGAVYPNLAYGGEGTFLLEAKNKPECITLYNIVSIQICIANTECAFYTSADCGASKGESAAFIVGHGDVEQVPADTMAIYGSYQCDPDHSDDDMTTPNTPVYLQTSPHDPSKDLKPGMVVCSDLPTGRCEQMS
ncbi:hypothetical protein EJ02DRAFT_497698 [Clathrospora elynae]|uniref:Uncharacterized protein n=1 Tax=Clathrospora elynae TaxID=706981 RepID=A0A6A5SGL3_9PLEO|nr:hypothetical protein EJ02DRAFT_497698 [Clathrospora elynae]